MVMYRVILVTCVKGLMVLAEGREILLRSLEGTRRGRETNYFAKCE